MRLITTMNLCECRSPGDMWCSEVPCRAVRAAREVGMTGPSRADGSVQCQYVAERGEFMP
jgi:hypothetical protein